MRETSDCLLCSRLCVKKLIKNTTSETYCVRHCCYSNNFDDISLNKMISDSTGNSFENSGNSSGAGSPDSTDSNNGSDKAIEGLSKSHEDIREILSSIEDKEITASQTDLFIEILQTFKELVETLEETDVNGVRNLLYKLLPSIIEDDSSKIKN